MLLSQCGTTNFRRRLRYSFSSEAGHWLAYEGRFDDRQEVVRERLCFRCCTSNVLAGDYHAWEINRATVGENWSQWPMMCRSRWT